MDGECVGCALDERVFVHAVARELCCPVCYDLSPLRILPCGHGVCGECLQRLGAEAAKGCIDGQASAAKCPLCKACVDNPRHTASVALLSSLAAAARDIAEQRLGLDGDAVADMTQSEFLGGRNAMPDGAPPALLLSLGSLPGLAGRSQNVPSSGSKRDRDDATDLLSAAPPKARSSPPSTPGPLNRQTSTVLFGTPTPRRDLSDPTQRMATALSAGSAVAPGSESVPALLPERALLRFPGSSATLGDATARTLGGWESRPHDTELDLLQGGPALLPASRAPAPHRSGLHPSAAATQQMPSLTLPLAQQAPAAAVVGSFPSLPPTPQPGAPLPVDVAETQQITQLADEDSGSLLSRRESQLSAWRHVQPAPRPAQLDPVDLVPIPADGPSPGADSPQAAPRCILCPGDDGSRDGIAQFLSWMLARDKTCDPAYVGRMTPNKLGSLLSDLVPVQGGDAAAERHVHRGCALWCPLVTRDRESGALGNLEAGVEVATSRRCSFCGKRGASVECDGEGCDAAFHLLCAVCTGPGICVVFRSPPRCRCAHCKDAPVRAVSTDIL